MHKKICQIISTKLHHPEFPELICREALISRLEKGKDKPVTLISAPAGYGKTSIASQLLYHTADPAAWVSLDENDNDPKQFLRYIIAAVRKVVPTFGTEAEKLLMAAQQPPAAYLADAMLTELGSITQPLWLVVDDFHKISHPDIQHMVIRILQLLPRKLHAVFLTRSDPPWPLARWRVSGLVNQFRTADLRFTLEEALLFFGDKNLSPAMVQTVLNQAEGWIAGLQLIKLTLTATVGQDQVTRSHMDTYRLVEDYLMEEVLALQDADVLHFLAVSTLFERFCAPLLDFLLSASCNKTVASRSQIDRIKRDNLFLVPLDREQHWYRYHHLFQELLKKQLDGHLSPERKLHLHACAGKWFSEHGLVDEALTHLIAANDYESATSVVEDHLQTVLDEIPDIRILERWLSLFPEPHVRKDPFLLVVKAWQNIYAHNIVKALSLIDQIKVILEPPSTVSKQRIQKIEGNIEAIQAFCSYWRGDLEGALRHATRAIDLVPKEHLATHGLGIIYAAGSHALLGHRTRALKLISAALAEDRAKGGVNQGQLTMCQAAIHIYAGEMGTAAKVANQFLESAQTLPTTDFRRGFHHYVLGSMAYENNSLEEARNHFHQVEKLRYRMDPRVHHDALLGLALVHLARGAQEGVDRYVSSARKFAQEIKDPSSMMFSEAFELRLNSKANKGGNYPEFYEPTLDYNQVWLTPLSLIRAEFLLHNKTAEDCTAALELVGNGLQGARRHFHTRQVIQFMAVKSVAHELTGDTDTALAVLEETLRLAEPLEFCRTILDRGPVLAGLLHTLAAKNPSSSYISKLSTAFARETANRRPQSVAKESSLNPWNGSIHEAASSELSNRELDILALLAGRLSNKEIAEQLCISHHTVKKHTVNIYHKLGVHKRSHAVLFAQENGLLHYKQSSTLP